MGLDMAHTEERERATSHPLTVFLLAYTLLVFGLGAAAVMTMPAGDTTTHPTQEAPAPAAAAAGAAAGAGVRAGTEATAGEAEAGAAAAAAAGAGGRLLAPERSRRLRIIMVRKTTVSSTLHIKTIILPRQARDKHGEKAIKRGVLRRR
jgi:hypothetical protein